MDAPELGSRTSEDVDLLMSLNVLEMSKYVCISLISDVFLTNGEDFRFFRMDAPELGSRTFEDVDLLMKFKCAGNVKICL